MQKIRIIPMVLHSGRKINKSEGRIFYILFSKCKNFLYICSEENIRGTPLKSQSLHVYPRAKYGNFMFANIIECVFLLPHNGHAIISIISPMLCNSIAYIYILCEFTSSFQIFSGFFQKSIVCSKPLVCKKIKVESNVLYLRKI